MDMLQVNSREVIIRDGIMDKHIPSHKDNLIMVSHKVMEANKAMASLKDMVGKHKVMDMIVQEVKNNLIILCLIVYFLPLNSW